MKINKKKKTKEVDQVKDTRIRSEETIIQFCNDLSKENWSSVYVKNVNMAYVSEKI